MRVCRLPRQLLRTVFLALVACLLLGAGTPALLAAGPPLWNAPALVRLAAGQPGDLDTEWEAFSAQEANQQLDTALAVPWNGNLWETMPSFTWAACDVTTGARHAIDIAIGQWQYAATNQGLPIRLSEVPCRNGNTMAQIALIETTFDQAPGPPSHDVFGLGVAFDARGRICGIQIRLPCVAQNALIELYTDNWVRNQLTFGQAAKTIAHEIGHAVGLGHAHFCNFDSIMAQNCEPILPGLGPDDIQSLDALVDYDLTYFGRSPLNIRPPAQPPSAGPTVTYHAGWNLVAGPRGSSFAQGTGPLYTLVAHDSGYRSIPSTQGSYNGYGYWAYFAQDVTVRLNGGGVPFYSTLTQPGHWFLVGNSSATTPMRVLGADAVYTFDAAAGGYQKTDTIPPGQAAWVLPGRDGEIAVFVTTLSRSQINCYLSLGDPASC